MAFDAGISRALECMVAWRTNEFGPEWSACEAGLREVAGRSEQLRLGAPDLGFESLLVTIEELLAPLDVFEAAEERLRRPHR